MSLYRTQRRRCFTSAQSETRLHLESLYREQQQESRGSRARDHRLVTGFVAELEEAQSSVRFIGLTLAQLARQENAFIELLENDNDNESHNHIANKRRKAMTETTEALRTML